MNLKKKLVIAACYCLLTSSTTITTENSTQAVESKIETGITQNQDISKIEFNSKELYKIYRGITNEDRIIEALELMKNTSGSFSRRAIIGNNLTDREVKIEFKDLSTINPKYANFEALGWKRGSKLYIYVNRKHSDAPAAALAALLSHEALHQDELNSLNEETYAWTMEATVWTQLVEEDPNIAVSNHPLVRRENMLKSLLEKGNYTNKYIKKAVFSNPGYQNLPIRSPGFEDENL